MHVVMRAHISGLRNGAHWPAVGDAIDLPDVEAAHMVAAGLAFETRPVESAETSATPAAEATVRRRGRPPGSKNTPKAV